MSKSVLLLSLLAALGVGWFVGTTTTSGGGGDALDAEVVELREEVARLRLALGERGTRPRAGAGLDGSGGGDTDPGVPPPTRTRTESFSINEFDDADKAFQALLAYGATMLDRGEEGHLALVRTIDATFFAEPGARAVRELTGGEGQAARFHYPLLRFALNREDQVADLTETLFKTMAEKPTSLAGLQVGTLGFFTDDIAAMLPGVVGPKRLETFRAYGKAILAAPMGSQPHPVQRARRNIQAALASWAPPITAGEAMARLQRGGISPEEATALFKRLAPEDIERLDVDTLIGPLIEADPWRVIATLSRAKLSADTLARLDERIIQGVIETKLQQSVVHYWLRATGRGGFEAARAFLETGLQRADEKTAGVFLLTALAARPGPGEPWVTWAEERYAFSDAVRVALKRMRREAAIKGK